MKCFNGVLTTLCALESVVQQCTISGVGIYASLVEQQQFNNI